MFFKKIKGPEFLNKPSDLTADIQWLESLRDNPYIDAKSKDDIEKNLKQIEYGIFGEKEIAYRLKTSGTPMYVLSDLNLSIDDLQAQIDFLVITYDKIYVIECKNLFGNLLVDESGNVQRIIKNKANSRIESPLSQCEIHRDVLKKVILANTSGISKSIVEKSFDDVYKSLVVIANKNCTINLNKAQKDVKDKYINSDLLAKYIKDNDNSKNHRSDKAMCGLSELLLWENKVNPKNYFNKYRKLEEELEKMKVEGGVAVAVPTAPAPTTAPIPTVSTQLATPTAIATPVPSTPPTAVQSCVDNGGKQQHPLIEYLLKTVIIESKPLGITQLCNSIYDAIPEEIRSKLNTKLTGKLANSWLLANGYLEEVAIDGVNHKIPSTKGVEIGIIKSDGKNSDGSVFYYGKFSSTAQVFIVENTLDILRFKG